MNTSWLASESSYSLLPLPDDSFHSKPHGMPLLPPSPNQDQQQKWWKTRISHRQARRHHVRNVSSTSTTSTTSTSSDASKLSSSELPRRRSVMSLLHPFGLSVKMRRARKSGGDDDDDDDDYADAEEERSSEWDERVGVEQGGAAARKEKALPSIPCPGSGEMRRKSGIKKIDLDKPLPPTPLVPNRNDWRTDEWERKGVTEIDPKERRSSQNILEIRGWL